MKTVNQIKQVTTLLFTIILIATINGFASENHTSSATLLDYNNNPSFEGKTEIQLENAEFELIKAEHSNSNLVVKYEKVAVGIDVQKTYFIPGAGFQHNGNRATVNFANELIDTLSNTLEKDFVIVKSSSKKIPFRPLRAGLNGRWAIMNGYKPVDYNEHGNVLRTVKEIETDFRADTTSKTLNIIGSSYGSVVAAQSTIALLERDNNIDSIGVLVITASMIDPNSDLGVKLESLKNEGKIHTVYFHPNPNDNITACSGKTKEEAKRAFKEVVFRTSPSITNMKKHQHNIAALDPTRAHHLLEVIVNRSPVTWVKKIEKEPIVAQQNFMENSFLPLASTLKNGIAND